MPFEDIERGLRMLKEAGMLKINFAGGEPFLCPDLLGKMVKFCKEDIQIQSVSIVTNASKITDNWFCEYAKYVDVLAVSVDSFNESVNSQIGRGKGNHLQYIQAARELCTKYNVIFKVNTVVTSLNWNEDMNSNINSLNPSRWKVFKVLILRGENDGNDTLRDATEFKISNEQFETFLEKHKSQKCLVPENNNAMQNSYLVLDEYMRFLDSSLGAKEPSERILKVGVKKAIEKSGFDQKKFTQRGGIYEWSRTNLPTACAEAPTW